MQIPERPKVSRIRWRTIGEYFLEVLNLERGLGYTTKKMLLDPRGAIREYLFESRERMIKPVTFLLLMTGISTFLLLRALKKYPELNQGINISFLPPKVSALLSTGLMDILIQYTNLFYMASIPFLSLASYWIFRRARLYFTEHLVINTYIFCIQSYLLFLVPFSMNNTVFSLVIMSCYFVYYLYAYTQVFQLDFWTGIALGLAVITISQLLSVAVSMLIIGILILLN